MAMNATRHTAGLCWRRRLLRGALRAGARAREAEAAGEGRGHARLDVVSRAVAQRHVHRNAAEPHAAASARLGVPERHQLHVAGRRRRPRCSSCTASPTRKSSSACIPRPARGIGAFATPPTSRIATATTTARDRARSSTAIACTPSARRGNCTASICRSGKLVWRRHIAAEYKVPQDFFGTASTPLVEDKLLIVNVGAPGGPCVVGLDKTTGREVWRAGKEWGPSYASPVPAVVHGKRRVFVFAGGESTPPTGGLLSIDPATGRVDFSFPWRSRSYESVNASCPVVFDNKVFISASYRTGGALLEIRPDFTHRVVWTTQEFGLHFNTPIYRNGFLYGFDGRNEPDASLACVDAATGKVVWRATPEWNETLDGWRHAATAAPRHLSRIAARGRWTVSLPRRDGTSGVDGSHAEGLQGDSRTRGCSRRANRGRCRCSAADCCTSCRTRATS